MSRAAVFAAYPPATRLAYLAIERRTSLSVRLAAYLPAFRRQNLEWSAFLLAIAKRESDVKRFSGAERDETGAHGIMQLKIGVDDNVDVFNPYAAVAEAERRLLVYGGTPFNAVDAIGRYALGRTGYARNGPPTAYIESIRRLLPWAQAVTGARPTWAPVIGDAPLGVFTDVRTSITPGSPVQLPIVPHVSAVRTALRAAGWYVGAERPASRDPHGVRDPHHMGLALDVTGTFPVAENLANWFLARRHFGLQLVIYGGTNVIATTSGWRTSVRTYTGNADQDHYSHIHLEFHPGVRSWSPEDSAAIIAHYGPMPRRPQ